MYDGGEMVLLQDTPETSLHMIMYFIVIHLYKEVLGSQPLDAGNVGSGATAHGEHPTGNERAQACKRYVDLHPSQASLTGYRRSVRRKLEG